MKRSLVLVSALFGGIALSWKLITKQAPHDLKGKVAIVTGASFGIGEAVVHALAAQGMSIVLVGRDAEELTTVEAALTQYNVSTLCIPADVTRDGEVEILVSTVMEHFGQIDVLVNTAGAVPSGGLQDIEPRQLRNIVAVNLYAPMRMSQRILAIMSRQGCGHIVNVASLTGSISAPGETASAATKAGLIAFTDALRRELEGTGIQVSLVLPGWVRTPAIEEFDHTEFQERGVIIPLMPTPNPHDIAHDIVDALHFNRREVITGGNASMLGSMPNRAAVPLVDLYFKLFGNAQKTVAVLEDVDV